MTTPAANVLSYLMPGPAKAPLPARRIVVFSVWCLASSLTISAFLMGFASRGMLPDDFLCCEHPEVSMLVFVAAPFTAGVSSLIAFIMRLQAKSGYASFVLPAIVMAPGFLLALCGFALIAALKA